MGRYSVVLAPEPEGGFTMTMPAFPDYVGFAETEEEALRLAREGIDFELDLLRERGVPPPVEPGPPKVVQLDAA
jgi:predicted RNase H-like HicB family nuclease